MTPLSDRQIDEAAGILWSHWSAATRLDALPEACRPGSRAEGYKVQAAVAKAAGQPTVGWKIAATSEAGQRHINVSGPLAGRLLASRVLTPGTPVPFTNNLMHVAEAEFCFRLARDLRQRDTAYTVTEVMDAVASAHPSIEVPDSRFNEFVKAGEPQLIADTACASWLVIGPAFADAWRAIDLAAHKVDVFCNGDHVRTGSGRAVLGDPRIALAWIANELTVHAGGLRAGDYVTTGTCVVPVPVAAGDALTADYGPLLGRFDVTIA